MMVKLCLFVLIVLSSGHWADAKRPQVFRSHMQWPESKYSFLVQELARHGFVQNGEFVKDKIKDHFVEWKNSEKLNTVIEGLEYCADEVITKGRNGDLDEFIQCVDKNEKVALLYPSRK